MSRVVALAIRHPFVVLLLAAWLLVAGSRMLPGLPVDILPEIQDPTVVVLTEAPGLPATEVEALVSVPVENALNSLPGLRRLRSTSTAGMSVAYAELDQRANLLAARELVREHLGPLAGTLPEGAGPPALGPMTSRLGEVMEYALVDGEGNKTLLNLRQTADALVAPRLGAVSGVAAVLHMGGEVPQYQVLVEPQKLLDFGITLDEVVQAVERANVYSAGGYLVAGPVEQQVEGLGRATSLEHFGLAVVTPWGGVSPADPRLPVPVTVESLATTRLGAAPRRGAASLDGRETVLGKVAKTAGTNTLAVTERLERTLEGLDLGGIRVRPIYQQATLIRGAVGAVLRALAGGALLVILVIALFLLRVRPTLISLASIPLSLLLTLVVLRTLGLGIDVMTLGGLAIAVGMVVDDSIIDVENVARRLREHFARAGAEAPAEATRDVTLRATLEIRSSIVVATLVIALVLVPLLGMGGLEGRLFAPVGITVLVAMVSSLVVSLLVTPALCQLLLARPERHRGGEASATTRLAKGLYRPLLDRALALELPVVLLALALIALAGLGARRLGREFLPAIDEGALVVNALLQPGTSLDESFTMARRIEKRLLAVEGVTSVATRTGRAEGDEHAEGVHYNEILVSLEEPRKRTRSTAEVRDAIRARLQEFPGVTSRIGQPISHRIEHLLAGTESQLAVKIFGPRLEVLRDKAAELGTLLRGVAGVTDVYEEAQAEEPTLRLELGREDLALYGIAAEDVVSFLETALQGKVVSEVVTGPQRIGVAVRLAGVEGASIERLLELRIRSPRGEFVPLKELVAVRRWPAPSRIQRENLSRRAVVGYNVASGADLGRVAAEVERRVSRELKLPEGCYVEHGGEWRSRVRALGTLQLQAGLALVLILLLLHLGLGSLRHALLVMLTMPFALAGGVLALVVGSPVLSISSAVGLVLVFGIATRNGILIVSHINALREEGMALTEAVRQGSLERLSPVLMTALSTALGMAPLALARGVGSELEGPLALAILGGTVGSTILTLLVLPVAYSLVEKGRAELVRARAGKEPA